MESGTDETSTTTTTESGIPDSMTQLGEFFIKKFNP